MIDKGDNSPTEPTGSNTLPSAEGAVDTQAIKQRLDDMNERWSQLRAKTVQIRLVLRQYYMISLLVTHLGHLP